MEEDRQFKYVCRFCSKSFPCGRSLGGHMRSHMIFSNNNSADDHKLAKKKFSFAVNNFISTKTNTEINGYVLRENPKKSKKLVDSSEDTSLLHEKFSKESGKPFFGSSMKSNSDKERVSNNNTSLEDQDSWTSADQNKQLITVTDSLSDNETATPNRRRRSKRRTRYMANTNSSSFSVANNNGSSSISEFEIGQEQEAVAMCLMMLSRDHEGPRGVFNYVAESSDNNSVFLEAEIEVKNFVYKKQLKEKKLESGFVDSVNCHFEERKAEFSASGISRNASKMNKAKVSFDIFDKNDTVNKSQLHYQIRTENSEVELGKKTELDQTLLGSTKNISRKKKIRDSFDPELGSDSVKKSTNDASDAELYKDSNKRNRFECATCNKIFPSYQALGGHRASHKKIKSCFASKIDSSENSIETQLSPDPTAYLDSKLIKSINNENTVDHLVAGCDDRAETSYGVKKRHECPICLKVFPSGQALGGHKRSHLLRGTEARNIVPTPTVVIENPIPEIRNFLNLNLPVPGEEDNNGHLGLKPWWISSSHKHKALVGLISN